MNQPQTIDQVLRRKKFKKVKNKIKPTLMWSSSILVSSITSTMDPTSLQLPFFFSTHSALKHEEIVIQKTILSCSSRPISHCPEKKRKTKKMLKSENIIFLAFPTWTLPGWWTSPRQSFSSSSTHLQQADRMILIKSHLYTLLSSLPAFPRCPST